MHGATMRVTQNVKNVWKCKILRFRLKVLKFALEYKILMNVILFNCVFGFAV